MSQTPPRDEQADAIWRTAHADAPKLSDEEIRQRNKNVIQKLQSDLNQELFEEAKKLFSYDFVFHDGGTVHADSAAMVEFYEALTAAMADLVVDFESIVTQFDRVAVRAVSRGTHLGNYRGMAPPSGAPVTFTSVCIFRFNSDGKIAEAWQDTDHLALLMQLGVIKIPGS